MENSLSLNTLSQTIIKEIELLPGEFREYQVNSEKNQKS